MDAVHRLGCAFTPNQEERIEAALRRRDELDCQCFVKLTQLLRHVNCADPEVKQLADEAQDLIRRRDRANNEFVSALSGRG